jgi:peptidoglycan/LPS O-acetylase OafA/YrhL
MSQENSERKGWSFYIAWAMVILPNVISVGQTRVTTQNGWVIECSANYYWAAVFGLIALVIVIMNWKQWGKWSYALGLSAIFTIAYGFNVGDMLCPEYVPPSAPARPMPPF